MVAARAPAAAYDGNVVQLVWAFALSQPDTPALIDKASDRCVTFVQLARDLDATAAALRAAGVRPKDRVALFVATGIEFVTLVFACFQAGAVPVLIDPGMGTKNVIACVKEQAPRVLLGIAKAHALRVVAANAFKSVKVKLLVGSRWFPGARPLASIWGTDGSVAPMGEGDTAAILYTSGSTGAPKGVVYTHGMLAGQASAIRDMFDIQPGEIDVACFLPFGLFSVAMGMTAVFPAMDFRTPATADPQKVLAALQGATSAFASPALWEPFSRFLEYRSIVLPGLRRVLTAGAPVRPALNERLLKYLPDGDVFTPYGATEALPVSFMSGREVLLQTAALTRQGKGTCVGRIAPGVEVRILDVTDDAIATMADGREMAQGTAGEIVVRGPCVTRLYDGRPEANRLAKIADGDSVWHRMGDLGFVDEQGRLWFCGRKSQRVTTSSAQLSSIPVEAVAETLWPERAALVGVGPRGAQRAIVVLEHTGAVPRGARKERWCEAEGARIFRALKLHQAGEHVDAAIVYLGAFPVDRRHNAKIERERLAAWVASDWPKLLAPSSHEGVI
jgi:acyl-CoA synthetase (AMP-forming)/AMP-acid ligase II